MMRATLFSFVVALIIADSCPVLTLSLQAIRSQAVNVKLAKSARDLRRNGDRALGPTRMPNTYLRPNVTCYRRTTLTTVPPKMDVLSMLAYIRALYKKIPPVVHDIMNIFGGTVYIDLIMNCEEHVQDMYNRCKPDFNPICIGGNAILSCFLNKWCYLITIAMTTYATVRFKLGATPEDVCFQVRQTITEDSMELLDHLGETPTLIE